jgi:hypothetical protein
MNVDPTHLNAQQLGELGADAVDHLAHRACGTLTSYRLLLGRCLLAMDRHRYHFDHGCCSSIHYACVVLGLKPKQARQFRYVASQLEGLPALSDQAVRGLIAWCKLREVTRVASCETEEFWIDLCHHKTYEEIERLVALTRPGELPVVPEGQNLRRPVHSDLRCQLSPEAMAVVERGLQALSQQVGRVLNMAEAVEMLFAQVLARQPLDEEVLEETRERALAKARAEAHKDLQSCPVRDTRFNPAARHTTPAQTRELQRRDGYRCSTPGCPHHLYLEMHHIHYYSHGGQTVPENLITLCGACHRNVHEGRLRIESEVGSLVFLDAQGRNLQREWRLDVADWLDHWIGWWGGEFNTHRRRLAA